MTQWDIFISYASEDKRLAQAVCEAIEAAGARGWIAFRNMRPGRDYGEQIIRALESVSVLVLVLTKHSNRSKHVLREVEYAAHRDLRLLVFIAEEVQLSASLNFFLHNVHWLEAFDPPPATEYLPGLTAAAKELLGEARNLDEEPAAGHPGFASGPVYGAFEVVCDAADGSPCELGRSPGGVATFKARDTRTHQAVALKVFARQRLGSPGAAERLSGRVESARRLRDARLATLLDCGEEAADCFQAWSFVEGDSLQAAIEREGAMESAPALRIVWQIARALEAVHGVGLTHGDIKPANVLLTQRNAPEILRRARPLIKLVDLRLTDGCWPAAESSASGVGSRQTLTIDSPAFSSPEKWSGSSLDIRSDFYSLGALLWYLLAGKPLFDGPLIRVMLGHMSEPLPFEQLPALPPEVRRLLGWLLEKDRERRPPHPSALLQAIEAAGKALQAAQIAPPPLLGELESSALPEDSERTVVSVNRNPALAGPMEDDIFASLVPGTSGSTKVPVPRSDDVSERRRYSGVDDNELELFGHYRVLRRSDGSLWELGRGAMGVTYKAEDTNLHTPVALKVINSLYLDNATARERFLREARVAASLRHRNVAAVHHLGQDGQTFFYAMEFIDGVTMTQLIREQGPQPWERVLRYTLQVARALAAAHDKHLVHRDIKPDNLMLVAEAGEDDLAVKVIDFGLTKLLAEHGGSVVNISGSGFIGTPSYASPEQCEEIAPDIRSDIYSLGVVIWYALTGAPVFTGPLGKVFAQHISAQPPWDNLPADVPEPVRTLLAGMLAKDRANRPQNPYELRRQVEAALEQAPAANASATIFPLLLASTDSATATEGAPFIRAPAADETVFGSAIPAASFAERPDLPTAAVEILPPASPGVAPASDALTFTACAPAQVCAGSSFLLDIWAHTASQRLEIMERALALGRSVEAGRKGPVRVARGSLLAVQLTLDGLQTSEPVDTLLWEGEIANVCFPINAPAGLAAGRYAGRASISAAGVPLAKLLFDIPVVGPEDSAILGTRTFASKAPRNAFASYASADRDEVLARLQGMRKVHPGLEVFVDVMTLRSGQNWREQIAAQAASKDVFFLFWSREAARSRWVDLEWRLALQQRGLNYIDPVPLQDPVSAPPPEELRGLHFHDSFLAFKKSTPSTQSQVGYWLKRCTRAVRKFFAGDDNHGKSPAG